jgi:hypothetical protein
MKWLELLLKCEQLGFYNPDEIFEILRTHSRSLVGGQKPSTNTAMVPCPHLFVGTDGVHHSIINQCNHPDVCQWAQHHS